MSTMEMCPQCGKWKTDNTLLSPRCECSLAGPASSASVMGNPMTESDTGIPASQKPARDVMKHTLPPKENHELAEELLARFAGLDRADLLKDMVAACFFDMRHGNKREERAACDFLNELQRLAIRNLGLAKGNRVLGRETAELLASSAGQPAQTPNEKGQP